MSDLSGAEAEPTHEPAPAPDHLQSSPVRLALLVAGIIGLGLLGGWPVLVIVLAIIVMIFLHELGHYLTAKWSGMKVTEFFIGFGPRIWSFQRGETEYGVKAIPAGAYVRIIGMNNLDEVDPADEARTYRQQPYWQRFSVAVAGSTMHFLLALVLLFIVMVGYGRPNETAWTVDGVTEEVQLDDQEPVDSPAQEAGLQPGDQIVEINGQEIDTFDDLRRIVEANPGETIDLVVERDGETITTSTTLLAAPTGSGGEQGFLGITGDEPLQRYGPVAAVGESFRLFGEVAVGSVKSVPEGVGGLFQAVFDPQEETAPDDEDPGTVSPPQNDESDNRIVSIVGATRIGAQATEAGLMPVLMILALINIFIGIFNLLPLLPLDGGHVAVATYEKFKEWRLGNRQRYFVDMTRLLPVTYAVVFVMITIGTLAIYMDIANPINLPGN